MITPQIPASYKAAIFVYVDFKPDGAPFYVGVGDAARVGLRKRHRNKHHSAILFKYPDCCRKIFCIAPNREYANAVEQKLIRHFGRACVQEGPLTNKSAGGDGYVNPSPEVRMARSKARTGKRWKNGPGAGAEGRAAALPKLWGNKHTLGYRASEETRAKQSAASKGKPKSKELRAKLAEARRIRSAKVEIFLKESGLNTPKKKVTNAMMDEWFSQEGKKCA